ncbi:hypothetical protein DOTSEDRAFT_70706 [Dothistroma septosporum NZE10]|uniref:LicD/FKTN/FKRP nucleotidyltransferase domain-containing protein n=1 Tax=Dothistroma septosporum (strain NZE10 / CBS 128990) TaxID=675120 RepID=N1PV51_DOTSN|nr:hypothetical protein DOTSEDRAFT_70706 [Dothistroma septosporum NZE10]
MRLSLSTLLCIWLFLQRATAHPVLQPRMADFGSVRTHLDRPHVNGNKKQPNKYFQESTFHQHYDGRFADRPLKYDEQSHHLSALIRTYLLTMESIGAETWLMHGTLLGWYWNRRIMPWDSDLDVMISETSLHFLAAYHNMTMHTFTLPRYKTRRSYMLEMNSHCLENGLDKQNMIDARWIDTDTGLFIDITTLRRNDTANSEPGLMVVKDKHHYMYDDIFPLRQSTFEGIPVSIPYAYPDILAEEYGDESLAAADYQHHHYDAEKQIWVPQAVLSSSAFNDDDKT